MILVTIKERLKEKGKSMYWLAKETGVSANAINKISNNKTTAINFEILEKVYYALECESLDEIITISKD